MLWTEEQKSAFIAGLLSDDRDAMRDAISEARYNADDDRQTEFEARWSLHSEPGEGLNGNG